MPRQKPKHPNAAIPGHPRTRKLTTWLSDPELEYLNHRYQNSTAPTRSAYQRFCLLGRRDIKTLSPEQMREVLNTMVQAAGWAEGLPAGRGREKALAAILDAFDRILPKFPK